jgi:hypothetical protein
MAEGYKTAKHSTAAAEVIAMRRMRTSGYESIHLLLFT